MMDLLFNDATAGNLACAKEGGTHTTRGVRLFFDEEGHEHIEEYIPEPYTGPTLKGSPDDIEAIWLMADIGDISPLSGFPARKELWEELSLNYGEPPDYLEKEHERARQVTEHIREAAASGEPIRVWWSNAPAENCGFYWAMHLLKVSKGPVMSVKLPTFLSQGDSVVRVSGTGELAPDMLVKLSLRERAMDAPERTAMAQEWERLARENAPLRVVLNGHIYSVDEDFYDPFLRQYIPEEECRVAEIIGRALGYGPAGLHDFWYAKRLRSLLDSGELKMVREAKRFYHAVVKKG